MGMECLTLKMHKVLQAIDVNCRNSDSCTHSDLTITCVSSVHVRVHNIHGCCATTVCIRTPRKTGMLPMGQIFLLQIKNLSIYLSMSYIKH